MKTLWLYPSDGRMELFHPHSAKVDGKLMSIGTYNGQPVYARRVDHIPQEEQGHIRDYLNHGDDHVVRLIVRASQLLSWWDNHRFCGRCGGANAPMEREPAMQCGECGFRAYPVLSPAVMVRIRKDDKILLARNHQAPCGSFGLVAGFVEAGETLEDAAMREVKEEVGINICNLQYFQSQSWPLPHTLLIGFTADYHSGEVVPDGQEIVEAIWADPREREDLSRRGSLSRTLMDDFSEVLNQG